ncbi:uncharacterized protein LOC121815285 isoform X1 [Haplochromis burtoni]|uniref:uncharacterized protein LOC121815285 isoform X1 n=1 Tax=Haplochromis burtoni TaxID=8153 RepID=UPI001C2D9A4D|nr:uncharacterized protein LOC121815285 isoform X1 [Haplochromis burtoni]
MTMKWEKPHFITIRPRPAAPCKISDRRVKRISRRVVPEPLVESNRKKCFHHHGLYACSPCKTGEEKAFVTGLVSAVWVFHVLATPGQSLHQPGLINLATRLVFLVLLVSPQICHTHCLQFACSSPECWPHWRFCALSVILDALSSPACPPVTSALDCQTSQVVHRDHRSSYLHPEHSRPLSQTGFRAHLDNTNCPKAEWILRISDGKTTNLLGPMNNPSSF